MCASSNHAHRVHGQHRVRPPLCPLCTPWQIDLPLPILIAASLAPGTTRRPRGRLERTKIIDVGGRPLQETRKCAGCRSERPEPEKADRVYRSPAEAERFSEQMQFHRIEQREENGFGD